MSSPSDFSARKLKSPSAGQNLSAPSSGRNTANSSPIDNSSSNQSRFNMQHPANSGRMGAGSPSYDGSASGSRLFSKRAREIQAEEGVTPGGGWGMPTSSAPSSSLRERENTIIETPETNDIPEAPLNLVSSGYRRARAGTVPSRFSPGGLTSTPPILSNLPSTSRPSPATTPFNAPPEITSIQMSTTSAETKSGSRLRSGSLNIPPRTNYVNPFGPSIFASNWGATRERSATNIGLPSIPSPAHSTFSKDDEHMAGRTLDYLGLVDTPQTSRATLSRPVGLETLMEGQRSSVSGLQPFLTELPHLQRSINRIRSYSVNAKEKYAEDEEEEETMNMYGSGVVTPMSAAAGAMNAQIQATAQALAMAQYAALATPNRSRARTVGVLEQPPVNRMKNYLATPSKLDSMTTASEMQLQKEYFELTEAIRQAQRSLAESTLGPSQEGLEGPTRSLWLGNIPASTTTTSLVHIFQPYGEVESARVLTHKNCGFINYTTVEHAIQARMSLNGKEIFPGAGPIRIGFAKPSSPNSNGAPTPNGGVYPSHSPEPTANNGVNEAVGASLSRDRSSIGTNGKQSVSNNIEIPTLIEMKDEILKIVPILEANEADVKAIASSIDTAIIYDDFASEIPSIPEPSHNRLHDAPKLREIRKRIDNGNIDGAEMEQIAIEMLPEIAELSSDYLGNTVVQKLFEHCNEETKQKMLDMIAPHLAEIGIHKNGTWAGQKIIDVAKTPQQMQTIRDCLRQYTIALFLDQYGNYVLQCCLRFGSPYNDYIFETMLSRMWDISQGRYGSRAVRACLESHHSSKNQQRMMAAAIALNAVSLATNANGALLLTWLLDTSTLPNRRTILAPRLIPHLVHLCTHKLAYLTVLKVINQKTEPEARETTLKALFFSEGNAVLEDILKDHTCGPTFIFKVLTTPFFEDPMRAEVIQNVRNILTRMNVSPAQGYKRLMDEVGLSTRANHHDGRRDRGDSANGNGTPHNRRSQNNSSVNTPIQAPRNLDAPTQPQFFSPPGMYDPSLGSPAHFSPNGGVVDPQALRALQEQSALYSAQMNAMYAGGSPAIGNPVMGNPALQLQLLQQQISGSNGRSPGFYGAPNVTGFNGQQQQPPVNGGEQFRGSQGSPMPPPGMGNMMGSLGSNAAYNPVVPQQLMGGYPYGGNQLYGNQQGQQSQNGNSGGRRQGRR